MAGVIVATSSALPRDIDVVVNVSKPQAETTSNFSVPVFVTPNAPFDQSADRVQVYDSLDAVLESFSASSEAYKAASAFFDQSPRPSQMAIGKVFSASVSGFLQCGKTQQNVATWKAVTAGSFSITIDGVTASVSGITFATVVSLAGVASALQTAIRAAGVSVGFTAATVVYNAATQTLRITSGSTGNASSVSLLSTVSPAAGVDISGAGFMNGAAILNSQVQNAYVVPGYTPAAQAGYLTCGVAQQTLATWTAVTSGSFAITIDGISANVTGINFTGLLSLAAVATAIQTKLQAAYASVSFTGATVTYNATTEAFTITSGTVGGLSSVSQLSAVSPTSGTDISGSGFMNGQSGTVNPGLSNIGDELALIAEAAAAQSLFFYGWTFDAVYRDTQVQLDAMAWIEGQTAAIGAFVTNSPLAYDPNSTTDVGAIAASTSVTAGYHRSFFIYHNNPYFYPDMAILAIALSVDYSGINTTITTKFKDLYGIPTVPVTIDELTVLESKRINTYTLVGNNAQTFREGTEANANWFIDDLINLDNMKQDLQVAVFNVFLQNKKVPYNTNGTTLLYNAIAQVLTQYVTNGTLSTRPMTTQEANGQIPIAPAYTITFANLASMTVADRAARIGPPCTIIANLAGAIHSITLNVEAYS